MKCSEIMSHGIKWVNPESTVKETVQLMKQLNCGAMPVADKEGNLKGIVTDRDIALFVTLQNKNPETTQLREFMNKDVITCYETDDLDTVINKMKQYKIRRMVILDSQNKLKGIISLGDIAVKAPQEEHKAFEAFEKISEPVHT